MFHGDSKRACLHARLAVAVNATQHVSQSIRKLCVEWQASAARQTSQKVLQTRALGAQVALKPADLRWQRGCGCGIGLSGHTNAYPPGVLVNNFVEDAAGRDAAATGESANVNVVHR